MIESTWSAARLLPIPEGAASARNAGQGGLTWPIPDRKGY